MRGQLTGTRTHNQRAEFWNSNSGPPRRHEPKPPRRAWPGAGKARGGGNPEWSWKPGPFICMLIPRMLPPSPPSLNGSAQFGVWNRGKFGTHTSLLLCNCGNFPPAHAVPAAQSSESGCRAAVAFPRQANLGVQPARGIILGPTGDKAPRPAGGAYGPSAGDAPGLKRLKGAPQTLHYPHFSRGCCGARGSLLLSIALASMLLPP